MFAERLKDRAECIDGRRRIRRRARGTYSVVERFVGEAPVTKHAGAPVECAGVSGVDHDGFGVVVKRLVAYPQLVYRFATATSRPADRSRISHARASDSTGSWASTAIEPKPPASALIGSFEGAYAGGAAGPFRRP